MRAFAPAPRLLFIPYKKKQKDSAKGFSSWSAFVSPTTNKTTHSGEIAPGNLSSIQTSFVALRKL
jgi:hypothetical protein